MSFRISRFSSIQIVLGVAALAIVALAVFNFVQGRGAPWGAIAMAILIVLVAALARTATDRETRNEG